MQTPTNYKMRKAFCYLVMTTLPCSSCFFDGNGISFDVEKQTISSSSFKGISRISINNDLHDQIGYFEWKGMPDDLPRTLSLCPVSEGYVYDGVPGYATIENGCLKLAPLTKYYIERAGGDEGAAIIKVETDRKGRIIKAD